MTFREQLNYGVGNEGGGVGIPSRVEWGGYFAAGMPGGIRLTDDLHRQNTVWVNSWLGET